MSKIQRYTDGILINDNFDFDNERSDWTYTGAVNSEYTPYGNRIQFGQNINIDTNTIHNWIFKEDTWSISTKIRISNQTSTISSIILVGSGVNDTFYNANIRYFNGVYTAQFYIYYNDSQLVNLSHIIQNFDNNKFYAITISCIEGSITMYVDGVAVDTSTYTVNSGANQTVNTKIGGYDTAQADYCLANLIVSQYGMSPEEAMDYYNNQVFDYMSTTLFTEYNTNGDLLDGIDETNATNIANNLKSDSSSPLGLTQYQISDFTRMFKHLIR